MMAKEKKKVPNLRFKGFTDDWEQRKLGDVVNFFSGLTYHPSDVKNKGYFVIRSSNIQNNQIVSADDIFVNKDIINVPNVKQGDIIVVVRNGSRKLIGKHAQVLTDMPNTVIGAFMTGVRSKSNFYINALLDSDQFQKEIYKNLGATINQITIGEFRKMRFIITSGNEAQTIGEFFKKIDTLITLQQRKLDLLKQFKKGLLQKMFADKSKFPILRFEGFTGNWEIRQLKELGEIITGNTPKTSQVENYSSNGIPWVTPTDINSVYTTDSAKRLSTVGKDKAKIAPANSLLVTCIASIGKNTLILQESAFNQQINALIPVKNDPFFLLAESAKWSRIMRNLAGQTSMQIINKKTFSGISTSIPDLKEQKIIGSLFKKLDNTIAFQQQRISRVNEIKKSLLQQMFI